MLNESLSRLMARDRARLRRGADPEESPESPEGSLERIVARARARWGSWKKGPRAILDGETPENRGKPLFLATSEKSGIPVYEKSDYKEIFQSIISGQDWLINCLGIVRSLELPDWYIGAGAIRNTVWDVLSGLPVRVAQDIDVVYFDASNSTKEKDREYEALLRSKNPNFDWDVVNQVRGHLVYHSGDRVRTPAKSSADSIATWSETATCVGVRLEKDNTLTVCAPHGLRDLMELQVRPVPEPYTDLTAYNRRVEEKQWDKRWPRLQIERYSR